MLTTAQEDAHLAKMIADSPASFTWSGNTYACAVDDIEERLNHSLEGSEIERQLPIYTRVALFTGTRPKRGDVITYSGTTYRVNNDVVSGVQLILYCVQEGG